MDGNTTDIVPNKDLTPQGGFIYNREILDRETERRVRQLSVEIKNHAGKAVEHIIEQGRRLEEVHSLLESDVFDKWLKCEFAYSRATAYRMMGVAKKFSRLKLIQLWGISSSALYLLASNELDDEIRQSFISKAASGEKVTHAEVKRAIDSKREKSITPGEVDVFDEDESEVDEPKSKPESKSVEPEKPANEWDDYNRLIDRINSAYRDINLSYRKLLGIPPEAKDVTNPIVRKCGSMLSWTNTIGVNNDQISLLEGEKCYGKISGDKLVTVRKVKIQKGIKGNK